MRNKKHYNVLENYIMENQNAHYRLAYSYVKNKEDALDIVQESICKALISVERLKCIDHIKPWFYKILINTSLDFIRKNKRIYFAEDMDRNEDGAEDHYEDFDLQRAMDQLPQQYRSIIVLRFFEDLKIADIAEILDENVNTIKTRLYKGLKKLRIELNPEEEAL